MHPLPASARASVHPVQDTYFGHTITDPYRWMEEKDNEEFLAWLRQQSDYTRRYCDTLPLRQAFLARLNEASDASVDVRQVIRRGERYFYLKRDAGENDLCLYWRNGLQGIEHLLVNPETLSNDETHISIITYNVSHNGQYISYLLSPGGAEFGEIRVMEVETGKETGDRIENTRWFAGEWLPDNHSLLSLHYPLFESVSDPMEQLQKMRVHQHTLGMKHDRPIFGYGTHPDIQHDVNRIVWVETLPGQTYVIGVGNRGVSRNSAFYIAPIDALQQTPIPWQQIATEEDKISRVGLFGDTLYLLTYRDMPRCQIVRTSLQNPDFAQAQVVFPESEAVIETFEVALDALYVQVLDGGIRRLYRLEHGNNEPQPLLLPYEGSAQLYRGVDVRERGILFRLNSWSKSPACYAYDPKTRMAVDTQLIPPTSLDTSAIEAVTVRAPSHDGVMIPLVILHKPGLARDGKAPVLMEGFGAYGNEITSPFFNPSSLVWLERGGIIALAGVRGGGEFGEEWHLAGKGATKPNTWKDFIACAEYLIREGYTSPAHLSGHGVSAGGILIGNAIAERPDLFGAAWILFGLVNMLRYETTQNGVFNIPEFGSISTENGFHALLEMDAYHKIKDGTAYPAVLLTHGFNDLRVEVWFSGKMGARLQAASSSNKPVLLHIDYDAGHGDGMTKQQVNEATADVYAFLWEQLGGSLA